MLCESDSLVLVLVEVEALWLAEFESTPL
ncbi:hypothetical protein SAU060112_40491 [Staphylococcus aureus]|nr:hypothetical protein SAU060112_40491 [Staphylococcus aureus]